MACNPSLEVKVARDAAEQLTKAIGCKVDRCVILFTTTCDGFDYVSYGETKAKFAEAKAMGYLAHAATFTELGE